ncbi:hypothetical protein BDY19DRAFT_897171 [Irpex rosettiformis]|uniref:Uncharacterized protein n=1 Tax=Irpex rosettiformis TaxID=378272 RepID=A0ACB8TSV6_9APHY|nr:hypothetical protein BDY19DRAFT_897171 [Irpex rosettiformis]
MSKNTQKANTTLAPIFGGPSSLSKKDVTSLPSRYLPSATRGIAQKRRATETAPASDHTEPSTKKTKTGTTVASRLSAAAPLAERLRPQNLGDFVGQPQLTAHDSLLMGLLRNGATGSMIFWGPPGCGKTTLARLLAKRTNAVFKELSATDAGISDVRTVAEEAKGVLSLTGRRTILFLDEVHRFNKAQQDIFLPFVEQGIIQLIGATTENPSFKITGALLSRCRVFVLERLTGEDIRRIVTQAIERITPDSSVDSTKPSSSASETDFTSSPTLAPSSSLPMSQTAKLGLPSSPENDVSESPSCTPFPIYPQLTDTVLNTLISLSNGDARTALSLLELVLTSPPTTSASNLLSSLRSSVSTSFDRTGDDRYDMISALHKSVRGSDGDAAMYWLARMLSQGEDPLYIARRMVVCASEDVGLADNHALPLAMAALQACQVIGMPECRINLAHLVAYLAEAPKDTRAYKAYNRAEEAARKDMTLPVPLMVRNAPTRMMRDMGYGDEYHYNPDYIHPVVNNYLPPRLNGSVFLKHAGDLSDKFWDEEALRKWETEKNDGKPWEGRSNYRK